MGDVEYVMNASYVYPSLVVSETAKVGGFVADHRLTARGGQ